VGLSDFDDRFPRICELLRQASRANRLGHAYLLVGDEPATLEAFAQAWVQVCACEQRNSSGDACGECKPCRLLAHNNYPELEILRPRSKSRTITVDEIRGFEHALGLTAGRRLKAGLIAEADRMGEQAQNAFLKTLEEPTRRTLLLLTTTQPRRLLPTIRSRCQVVSLLQNRNDYTFAGELGLFGLLAQLSPGAGAGTALRVAKSLSAVLGSLRSKAAETAAEETDDRWDVLAESDKALQKRLQDEQRAREAAEYLRLRQHVSDAIHAWFLQRYLMAAGVETELLPHPEIIDMADGAAPLPLPPSCDLAERDLELVEQLMRLLSTNASEELGLEAFCLLVCEKIDA